VGHGPTGTLIARVLMDVVIKLLHGPSNPATHRIVNSDAIAPVAQRPPSNRNVEKCWRRVRGGEQKLKPRNEILNSEAGIRDGPSPSVNHRIRRSCGWEAGIRTRSKPVF